ncbi:hypothetical protein AAHA92_27032 [Salvia divinorum]|uniref:Agglutinin domain-containing protein n=1 Tax=Salvia divinorum TaxID=28513 RepID=A0ABD1G2E7_SALDI
MATTALPRHVVFTVPKHGTNTYMHSDTYEYPDDTSAYRDTYVFRQDDGFVFEGKDDIFSEQVKIEIEPSKTDDKCVHLRFSHKNKYWQKNAGDDSIVAVSNKPEEDREKESCTLFEVIQESNVLYFTHVQTGWSVTVNNSTRAFYLAQNSFSAALGFVDWDTLVKLPKHVAFLGDNRKYLMAVRDNHNYLQFGSDDTNDILSGYEVSATYDGHVRIKSDQWGLFWRWADNSIWADSDDVTADDIATLFWPVKIDERTIALRCAGNNKFCKRLTDDTLKNYLNAAATNITTEARLKVQELVMERKIYNVMYRMEDARIYEETPYLAGTTTVTNNANEAGSIAVTIKYKEETSYYFSQIMSVSSGVKSSITAEIPSIGEASIETTHQISTAFRWNNATTTIWYVTKTGTVTVPARSVAVVHYVGMKGTCDVPFSYTQQDMSSIDGKIMETDQIDGVFTGVNAYSLKFTVHKYEPLPE